LRKPRNSGAEWLAAGKLKGEIMGTVYKGTFTKPLPAAAKTIVRKGQRPAQWQNAKGKRQTAPPSETAGPNDNFIQCLRSCFQKTKRSNRTAPT